MTETSDSLLYPELETLRQVCDEVRFDYPNEPEAIRWFGLFHVAYKETSDSLNQTLSSYVIKSRPDVIFVTFRQPDSEYAFSPLEDRYESKTLLFRRNSFALKNYLFELTTEFRKKIFNTFMENVEKFPNALTTNQVGFVEDRLTFRPTQWATAGFEANGYMYTRKQASYNEIDELPF